MFQDIQQKLTDPAFRRNIMSEPGKYAKELGYDHDDVEYKVVVCAKDTQYLVLDDYSSDVVEVDKIQAAGEGSASSVSSVGTVGCVCGTFSTGACAGTAGTRA